MKNIFKIAAVALAVAGVFSCTPKAEYRRSDYASMYTASMNVDENVGSIEIPVRLYSTSANETKVTYKVVEGGAKANENFKVGGDGVLTFAAGDTLKVIPVTIVNKAGEFTGALDFAIVLESATNDALIGAFNECNVTIGDLDHPLTSLFGDYSLMTVFLQSNGSVGATTIDCTLSQYDGNPYRVWLSNLIPFCDSKFYKSYCDGPTKVYGEVAEDLSTITIPTPQTLGTTGAAAFGVSEYFVLYPTDDDDNFLTDPSQIVFVRQDDGSYITETPYGMTAADPSEGMFWYYMNVFSTFSAKYPTQLVKL